MATRSFTDGALVTLTLAQIRQNLRDDIAAHADLPDLQTGTGTRLGAFLDVIAGRLHNIEEALPDLLDQFDVDSAEGQALENLADLVGLEKDDATASTVTLTLSGTAATVVPAGSRARVDGGAIFELDAAATIGGGGTVDAAATCVETGPYEADAGSIDTIVDAVSGWTGVTNAAAATVGQNAETDEDLREKLATVGTGLGYGHPDKLEADLRNIDSVTSAHVIDNDTDSTDSYSTPPHSIQAVVYPSSADTDDIAEALYNNKSGGIQQYGSQSETVTSYAGKTRTLYWSWPSEVDIYVKVLLARKDSASITAELQAAVKDLVDTYGATLGPGDDVLPDLIEAEILSELASDWDLRQCEVYVSTSSVPSSPYTGDDDPIVVTFTQVSAWDTANMSVAEVS